MRRETSDAKPAEYPTVLHCTVSTIVAICVLPLQEFVSYPYLRALLAPLDFGASCETTILGQCLGGHLPRHRSAQFCPTLNNRMAWTSLKRPELLSFVKTL